MTADTIDRYAVFGNPVAHSKSPQIHTEFARQSGQKMVYLSQLVPLGEFAGYAQSFFAGGGRGLNVTLPFKQEACTFAMELTPRAERAGAVNTLIMQANGRVLGENTDGPGLLRDLKDNLGWAVEGKSVLVLGAGGAVRGILESLFDAGVSRICIANRTADKALRLALDFSSMGDICGQGLEQLNPAQARYDLIVNGTSASLTEDAISLPDGLVHAGGYGYDLVYSAQPTPFMSWIRNQGASATDGLGMLVCQAAESFRLWRGKAPETGTVIKALRSVL